MTLRMALLPDESFQHFQRVVENGTRFAERVLTFGSPGLKKPPPDTTRQFTLAMFEAQAVDVSRASTALDPPGYAAPVEQVRFHNRKRFMIMKCMQALRAAAVPRPGLKRARRAWRWSSAFLCWAGLAAAGAIPVPALAVPVTLNTSALAGVSARLEFLLLDGDAAAANSVRVSGLAGGTPIGFDCTVGCTGGPPFVLDDSTGLGSLLYDLTLGSSVSFDLLYTTNYAGVPGIDPPDRFALSLLDPATNFTLVRTDIVFPGDALLTIDLIGSGVVQLAGVTNPQIDLSVPEPGSFVLAAIALGALGRRRAAAALRTSIPG